MPRYSNAEIEKALREARGMVYIAAKRLGCSPNTIKARLIDSPNLREVVEAESGIATDTAELALFKGVTTGEPWAVQFYLRTKGKDRGYSERHEVTGADGGPIRIDLAERDRRLATLAEHARTRLARQRSAQPE